MDRKLDFSAFGYDEPDEAGESKLKLRDISGFWSEHAIACYAIAAILGLAMALLGSRDLMWIFSRSNRWTRDLMILGIAVVMSIPIVVLNRKKARIQRKLFKFAIMNDLTYKKATCLPSVRPIMFNLGSGLFGNDSLTWANGTMISDYQYDLELYPSDDNSVRKTQKRSFARVKLSRHVPHMLLDCKTNRLGMNQVNYNVQKLQLEGDFAKFFDLYVAPGYHLDALQIFTPDVMAVIMDFGRDYDYELIDDEVYIFSKNLLIKDPEHHLRSVTALIEHLAPKLSKQAATYRNVRLEEVPYVHNHTLQQHAMPVRTIAILAGIALVLLAGIIYKVTGWDVAGLVAMGFSGLVILAVLFWLRANRRFLR
ncbi:hypothetical protein FWF74_02070 [Candidatus Saccharibacteria bacterium]|nr:hypothetical protein [Candidatus Saccharibacteria bacterium]MCL1963396.1 hypothetical protein [Candidatus Saccharibacteria bacterium]